ncbi:MAG: SoxR reducing system RseC family protein, partial [Desulfobacteraceae bacterium]|nr:SoxR reducing system RseC family protein [Desulfobacteraceae bacterium]
GDLVVIGLETKPLLLLSFLLYVFPIILLIFGAVLGNISAALLQINPSIPSIFSGFVFFAISFFIIRKKSDQLSQNEGYKPFLVRKKTVLIPSNCSLT